MGNYRKFILLTIGSVYLLILAGGVVRSTGSGMGCPDWPKCFGQWIPPTQIEELPADYKEIYSAKRHRKNLKLAGYLEALGYAEVAEKLRTDKSIRNEETFNATKTWIEYLNRLLGVIVGLLIFLNLIITYTQRNRQPALLWIALATFLLVAFQGWIGSVVVSTNLLGGVITLHMILALVILAMLIYNYRFTIEPKTSGDELQQPIDGLLILIVAGLILFTIQVIFGTQVRESVDLIASRLGEAGRSGWISELGLTFYVHRSFSLVVLIVHGVFAYLTVRYIKDKDIVRAVYVLIAFVIAEILSGAVMAYFGIPAFLQPVHLVLATLIFGIDFYLCLQIMALKKIQQKQVKLKTVSE